MAEPRRTGTGPGRVLVAVYAVFALSASARALVQLSTAFDEAPLAYSLSAVAGAVYILATVALSRRGRRARVLAYVACSIELVGVFAVGAFSLIDPARFSHPAVWSDFGQGYGYVPAVLPVIGLLWLRHTRARDSSTVDDQSP